MKIRLVAVVSLLVTVFSPWETFHAQTCTYSVSPSTVASEAGGGAGLLTVTASDPSCSWTASSSAGWATVSDAIAGYAGRILNDGAVGYWRLNESSGAAVVSDFSGHELTGIVEGGVSLQQTGAITGDSAVAFDGPAPSPLGRPVTGPNEWTHDRSLGQDDNDVCADRRIGGRCLDSGTTSSGHAQLGVGGGSIDSAGTITDDAWHRVAGTWDGAWLSLYVDGALDTQSA